MRSRMAPRPTRPASAAPFAVAEWAVDGGCAAVKILVTGACGFIGFHMSKALTAQGHDVDGIDILTPYYAVTLKERRLDILRQCPGFTFYRLNICDHEAVSDLCRDRGYDVVLHLAAQAGVRHSIDHPFDYAQSNVTGHLSILEACRHMSARPLLVYASSSSVYGVNASVPFRETETVDQPISLYAATKRADELMSSTYAHLYGLNQIGLRFFTVYGPWGRPDMAYWKFTEQILNGEPIEVFNNGQMERDFTYIDDVVKGVVAVVTGIPDLPKDRPHRIYNIGNNRAVKLNDFIAVLETALGLKAERRHLPMQPGDVPVTRADIDRLSRDYGYDPRIPIEDGLPKFVQWYREYHEDPQSRPASSVMA